MSEAVDWSCYPDEEPSQPVSGVDTPEPPQDARIIDFPAPPREADLPLPPGAYKETDPLLAARENSPLIQPGDPRYPYLPSYIKQASSEAIRSMMARPGETIISYRDEDVRNNGGRPLRLSPRPWWMVYAVELAKLK